MSRRPPQPQTEDDLLARMAPGGRMWSESPVRPTRRRRTLGSAGQAPLRWQDYPDTYTWGDHPDTLTWDALESLADLEAAV